MTFLYAFSIALLRPFKAFWDWSSQSVRQAAQTPLPVLTESNSFPVITRDIAGAISLRLRDESSKELEAKRSQLAQVNRAFGLSFFQKNRLVARLLQFAADGQFEHLFKLYSIKPELRQQILFALAGSAEQDKMEVILKKHPELLTASAPLTDISGIHFESITVFQHAVWAGDVRYMANMMLDCIPNTEAGEQIRLKLVEQYNDLMANGVCCQFNGQTYREKQFSLTPLIEALATYVKEFDNWDWPTRENHWCKVVGGIG